MLVTAKSSRKEPGGGTGKEEGGRRQEEGGRRKTNIYF
jgi:hypothetical protein